MVAQAALQGLRCCIGAGRAGDVSKSALAGCSDVCQKLLSIALYVHSGSETASSADSIAISPADVEICHHPDGRAWVLGAGHFGKGGFADHLQLAIALPGIHLPMRYSVSSRAVVEPELKVGRAGVPGTLAGPPRCGDQAVDLLCRRDASVCTGRTSVMPLTLDS
jgi:hypothetical protein